MSQLVSDKILGNQLEGLLDEDSLSCFNIAKTKNKLKKEHDFILERTYYNKLIEAREMLPKISANYDFSTKVDGTITSNKIENYMIHLEKIEGKYKVYRDNVMSRMNGLTLAEKIFIEEVVFEDNINELELSTLKAKFSGMFHIEKIIKDGIIILEIHNETSQLAKGELEIKKED